VSHLKTLAGIPFPTKEKWPVRDELQQMTKGGKYGFQSQSVQMAAHACLTAFRNTADMRKKDPEGRRHYPKAGRFGYSIM